MSPGELTTATPLLRGEPGARLDEARVALRDRDREPGSDDRALPRPELDPLAGREIEARVAGVGALGNARVGADALDRRARSRALGRGPVFGDEVRRVAADLARAAAARARGRRPAGPRAPRSARRARRARRAPCPPRTGRAAAPARTARRSARRCARAARRAPPRSAPRSAARPGSGSRAGGGRGRSTESILFRTSSVGMSVAPISASTASTARDRVRRAARRAPTRRPRGGRVGEQRLLERGREPLDELVRQAADEADRVGHEVAAPVVLERARGRVERLEQPVVHRDVRVGERVQERRLARVRVAGERDDGRRRPGGASFRCVSRPRSSRSQPLLQDARCARARAGGRSRAATRRGRGVADRPPPRRSRCCHMPRMRGRLYSSCASSTWSLPSAVTACWAKMSRMSCVRSTTRSFELVLEPALLARRRARRRRRATRRLASPTARLQLGELSLADVGARIGRWRGAGRARRPAHARGAQQLAELVQLLLDVAALGTRPTRGSRARAPPRARDPAGAGSRRDYARRSAGADRVPPCPRTIAPSAWPRRRSRSSTSPRRADGGRGGRVRRSTLCRRRAARAGAPRGGDAPLRDAADREAVVLLAGHLDTVPAQGNIPGRIEDGARARPRRERHEGRRRRHGRAGALDRRGEPGARGRPRPPLLPARGAAPSRRARCPRSSTPTRRFATRASPSCSSRPTTPSRPAVSAT